MTFRLTTRLRLCLCLLVATCATPACAQPDGLRTSSDYIAGFVRYVYWPDEDRITAWDVCIVGALPVGEERGYDGRLVRGKQFVVRRVSPDATAQDCRILDLTVLDEATAQRWLLAVRHLPILTVGSGAIFCSDGGHICLHPLDSDHGFDINLSALRDAGLGISARLLKLVTMQSALDHDGAPTDDVVEER